MYICIYIYIYMYDKHAICMHTCNSPPETWFVVRCRRRCQRRRCAPRIAGSGKARGVSAQSVPGGWTTPSAVV